ncbi:site-specific integrase [Parasedimentitalea maritima]|uniref:Site-specific integrase n=1 Tax=Parasedimentitalea maritima TaxID=2578117 RepID=A0ABY2UXL3_9RHOB|nr:site-specific integrase [Zongyanglinia marina]TLP67379.1 site-specific integrase [Zongyanglinia marina]
MSRTFIAQIRTWYFLTERHSILGNKVKLYRRQKGGNWHCYTFLKGTEWRKSTKQKNLALAKEVAEDWYLELRNKDRFGELALGTSFEKAAKTFEREYEAITQGRRSPKWVQGHKNRIRLHLQPHFGKMPVKDISSGSSQEYRVSRMSKPADRNDEEKKWKPPARNTIHNEIVTLSMVLKTTQRHGWIETVPDVSDPYRRQSKIEHRPWFTPKEYKQLYEATRRNAAHPKSTRFQWHAQQLHDFVLFMVNTGLCPDEIKQLEFRDIEVVDDDFSGDRILEIEVRGKRGVGYCKGMPGAVRPFERLLTRQRPDYMVEDRLDGDRQPRQRDLLFPNEFKKMFNGILVENDLKLDRHGKARTAYSLRHSYICFRLLEGADIYQVAKNCRTSVEMIEKHYAAHLKDLIDTSLVDVRRSRRSGGRDEVSSIPEIHSDE